MAKNEKQSVWLNSYNFLNNIFFNLSAATNGAKYSFGSTRQIRNIKNNVFYGSHIIGESQDSAKLISDPLFIDLEIAMIGLNTVLNGYKLLSNFTTMSRGRLVSS